MAVLSLEHVTLRYGEFAAVAELSLSVPAGVIYGLLGPNGSGKSTTLAAIAGEHRCAEGVIHVAGHTAAREPMAYRRLLGLVPQEIALFEELTAEQNLTFFGRLYGLRGQTLSHRVEDVLGFVRLREQARRPARTYSGGMKRRLNLACAILHEPRLLLLDEPTVGLDIQSREALFACLRQLRDAGTAMVFTTHHLEEAEELCDRVGIIDHGRLLTEGTPRELCEVLPRWRLDGPHAPAPRQGLERVFLDLTGRSLRDS